MLRLVRSSWEMCQFMKRNLRVGLLQMLKITSSSECLWILSENAKKHVRKLLGFQKLQETKHNKSAPLKKHNAACSTTLGHPSVSSPNKPTSVSSPLPSRIHSPLGMSDFRLGCSCHEPGREEWGIVMGHHQSCLFRGITCHHPQVCSGPFNFPILTWFEDNSPRFNIKGDKQILYAVLQD